MGANKLDSLPQGEQIIFDGEVLTVPDNPIVPYIEGDGIGVDISPAMKLVVDAAVEKAYSGRKKIAWWEIFAGEKAFAKYEQWLPMETVQAVRDYHVVIKGPLTTPVGGGIRSLNVQLRQDLDLYACVRPVRWFEGVPSPVLHPEDLDVVIFRENSEDTYLGIEFSAGSDEANQIIGLVEKLHEKSIKPNSGIGIKPMSKAGTVRLCKLAIEHAIKMKLPSISIVHKGNIMKFTEGAFREWSYEFFKKEYADYIITEDEVYQGKNVGNRIIIKDRIADAMFQQLLLRPDEYSLIVTPNLNGDYISDACAAQVGGLGMAPGANIGDGIGLFEATHGTAPKYAGQDKVNPGSLILSACMMLDYMGWQEAARLIQNALAKTIGQKQVTYDLERQMDGATLLSCSGFAKAVIGNL